MASLIAFGGGEGVELPNLQQHLDDFEEELVAPLISTFEEDSDRMVQLRALGLR